MESRYSLDISSGTISDPRFAAAYRVLDQAIETGAFPGCSFGVLAGGRAVLQDARGRFTYDADAPAVTAGTIFDLASVSKVVATTAIAMLLYQRGKLDLDMPLGAVLPEFFAGRTSDDPARGILIRHLLAHSSGLPSYVEFFRTASTTVDLLKTCLNLPLEARPGTRACYSDPGFILLGKALETISGEPLDVFANREIFVPLGMASTCFRPPPESKGTIPPTELNDALRHRRIQGEVQDENAWIMGGVAGHAGLFSNVADVLRFAAEILNCASARSGQTNLFEAATINTFANRQGPEESSRALGWDTPSPESSSGRYFSPRSIGHLGYSGCSLWIDLQADVAVAFFTNRTWPDRKSQLIRQVRPAFHDAIREAL